MNYMLLIYDRESNWSALSQKEQEAIYHEYMAFTKELRDSGAYVAGDALQPVATATTVRVREGKTMQTDGPFAETREQLGGYYLVQAKDLDEAVKIAAKIPSARMGAVEVRAVVVFG